MKTSVFRAFLATAFAVGSMALLPQQAAALRTIVGAVQAAAGTYGVTDYRWFNLRDNRSAATGLFQQVGLLRDTYARKPAFGAYRDLIRRLGR